MNAVRHRQHGKREKSIKMVKHRNIITPQRGEFTIPNRDNFDTLGDRPRASRLDIANGFDKFWL